MREVFEFRVPEDDAARRLPPGVGVRRGGARKLSTTRHEPLFEQLRTIEASFRRRNSSFFTAWTVRRTYAAGEIESTELFRLSCKRIFEPAGEECGTRYDDNAACPRCGGNAQQMSVLRLDHRRIPRLDFAETIAGELVVSARAATVFERERFSGIDIRPVELNDGVRSDRWFQLGIVGSKLELASPTQFGSDPFDVNEYGRTDCGHVRGLNLLTEVTVKRPRSRRDVMATAQLVGVRRGLLRPQHVVVLSWRVWKAIRDEKLAGLNLELAYFE